ncbi:alpha/beta fold hydrolase [Thermoactinospora rubra]|uniref:alpha/beta fold hydrolase n=1 Tax=Thermoactinospora rubra TaxID=1088767 RepID=UPI000A1230B3|nr:alpha/beta fold hydrolase [Thermoactinospora rubra]
MTMPGLKTVDHEFAVPLDHAAPDGPAITVFAREIADPGRAGEDLPWVVFLQGGPGGRSPRPTGPAYFRHILKTHRVLLLDQRGTGRSTPVTAATLAGSDAEIARYLTHFRADAIVGDCEHIRRELGVEKWETWGQSYGGFITLTYLSLAPESLRACHVTGGLPGLDASADDVYARTYPRVRAKVGALYRRYPEDAAAVRRIAEHLAGEEVLLPDGDRLTVARFKSLGHGLGMADGLEKVHWLLEEAWTGGRLSDVFLYDVMMATGFHGAPLYAVLHESIYAQGTATRWAAHRLLPGDFTAPEMLTGEMIYPWMFEDMRALRPFRGAAELLAAKDDWPALYDPVRLAANEVPVAAVVYHDDMYVDAGLSLETAGRVGNLRVWVTSEYEHDGFRADGERVTARLMDMAAGRI